MTSGIAHGAPTSLAGCELDSVRHVCALFNSDDEEYSVLLPFIRDGFDCGHKGVHLVNPGQQADHLQRLSGAGVDVLEAQRTGQLDVRANAETYRRDGHFDQDEMLATFEGFAKGDATDQFSVSRIVCRMDWAANDQTDFENLIEFESRVNDLWLRHNHVVICTYHVGQFSGEAVIDIVRTHPLVIIGGVLHQNPFFLPPGQFLPEYRARKSQPAIRRAGR